jgi:hypothetical protein
MFILVRTDFEAAKHDGITFLLMDMSTPGVSVRPILLISGSSPFCETSDVRARTRRRRNNGWSWRALPATSVQIPDAFRSRERNQLAEAAREHVGVVEVVRDPGATNRQLTMDDRPI